MLTYKNGLIGCLQQSLRDNYGQTMSKACRENVVNIMTNEFPAGTGKKTYKECVFLEEEQESHDYKISQVMEQMLRNPDFYKMLEELVDFGIERYRANYSNRYRDTDFVLYQKYTYEDVCRLLNWENNEVPLNILNFSEI